VLLFGELNEQGLPQAVLAHFGSEASELCMVWLHVRELLLVRKTHWSPRFDHLYAAILALGGQPVQFEELGSTLPVRPSLSAARDIALHRRQPLGKIGPTRFAF